MPSPAQLPTDNSEATLTLTPEMERENARLAVTCPVSFCIYLNPVKLILKPGPNVDEKSCYTYEKQTIELLPKKECPMTGLIFTGYEPDNAKSQQVAAYLRQYPEERNMQYNAMSVFLSHYKLEQFTIGFIRLIVYATAALMIAQQSTWRNFVDNCNDGSILTRETSYFQLSCTEVINRGYTGKPINRFVRLLLLELLLQVLQWVLTPLLTTINENAIPAYNHATRYLAQTYGRFFPQALANIDEVAENQNPLHLD